MSADVYFNNEWRSYMEKVTYTVRPGNTLFAIAQFFGTTGDMILKYNSLADPNQIDVEQELIIPVVSGVSGYPYIVRPGDTLWTISQRFGTTIDSIKSKNNLDNPNIIYPGTTLII
jgi:spore germination protein